jgi:hypothetical protein
VFDRAGAALEREPRAGLARAEAGAIEELAGAGVLADEGAHLGDELGRRQLTGLGVVIVLVHHDETHG